jgi:hypothetical protein
MATDRTSPKCPRPNSGRICCRIEAVENKRGQVHLLTNAVGWLYWWHVTTTAMRGWRVRVPCAESSCGAGHAVPQACRLRLQHGRSRRRRTGVTASTEPRPRMNWRRCDGRCRAVRRLAARFGSSRRRNAWACSHRCETGAGLVTITAKNEPDPFCVYAYLTLIHFRAHSILACGRALG